MPPRFGDTKTTAKGLFPGATVKPGKDWQGNEPEGKYYLNIILVF